MKRMHIGIVIGICLIVYWYLKDHPQILHPAPAPAAAQQGYLMPANPVIKAT